MWVLDKGRLMDNGNGNRCFFSKEAEATYDRSIEALAKDAGVIK